MATLQDERKTRTVEERREDFCRCYIRTGGKLHQSAIAAGYPSASASVRANELMKMPAIQARLDELLREKFVTEGTKAHETVLRLSKKSTQADAVKLRAAKELMILGGMFKKADAAAHAADAEKRGIQSTREGYALLARAAADLLMVPGITTGITFDDSTGTVTVTNTEHATDYLTSLYRGFQSDGRLNPDAKSHPEWGVWHDWKSRPSLGNAAPPVEEPIVEDEEWAAI